MKKNLYLILAIALAATLLGGCSMFATGDGGSGDSGSGSSFDDIKMTESYTFTNPDGLEFEKRYVIHADENSQMVSEGKEYGIKAMYSIIYADAEDAPVSGYDFTIVDTAEHAQEFIKLCESQGITLTAAEEDPCVLCGFSDGDTLEGAFVMYQSYNMIEETTVSAYVEFYAGSIGGSVE